MSIIINIKLEAQAELKHQAAAHGVQLERTLQELAQFSAKIPLFPDEVFTREGLYQDHD